MPQSVRLNFYGFSGLIAAVLSIAAYFVLKSKQCWIYTGDYDTLAIIQITGTVCGSVIFLLGLLNNASMIYNIRALLLSIVVAIIIVSGLMFWAVYIAYSHPCIDGSQQIRSHLFDNHKNAFTAEDGHNIAIIVLDIVAGLTLLSIGLTFSSRLFAIRL